MDRSKANSVEDELQSKFRKNWSMLKDRLSPEWKKILDHCLENGICNFDDFESIKMNTASTHSEKIETILLKVVKSRTCSMFLSMLDGVGFDEIGANVRATVLNESEIDRNDMRTNLNQGDHRDDPIDLTNKAIRDLKKDLERHHGELRSELDARDRKLHDRFAELKEGIEFYALEKQRLVETMHQQYIDLQSSHANARDQIDRLTKLAQEKNFENTKLKTKIEQLEDKVIALELYKLTHETADNNDVMLETQREEINKLKEEYTEKVQEVEDLSTEIEKQKSITESKEGEMKQLKDELRDLKRDFEELKIEKENLERDQELAQADKANDLMGRLESLLRDHEMTTPIISGKPFPRHMKGRNVGNNLYLKYKYM